MEIFWENLEIKKKKLRIFLQNVEFFGKFFGIFIENFENLIEKSGEFFG